MIAYQTEQLPQNVQENIRIWLGRTECGLLIKVVDSMVKEYQTKALNDALEADQSPPKVDAANANLMRAQVYQNFLNVLDEVINSNKPYTVIKLS